MKVYKIVEEAQLPEFATSGSACFDIRACFRENERVRAFNTYNKELMMPLQRNSKGELMIQVHSGFRMLIPTGLIFNIPDKHMVKLYIRSSVALKNGIHLGNDVGIIDHDYTDEVFVMVHNRADTPFWLVNGERFAQGSLEKTLDVNIEHTKRKPRRKTEREGGLGSTGK